MAAAPSRTSRLALLLKAAAHEIAASLAEDSLLALDGPTALLSEALLEECPDASDAAAMRCMLLRTDLLVAVRQAIAKRPESGAQAAAEGPLAPAVRVEVRGTAGRKIQGAFTVGSSPLCDVQAYGDASVLPLQCVAVPLPGGLLVVDAWSRGASRMAWWRAARPPWPPQTGCGQRRATPLPHGARAVFRIGEHTTVAFGPRASTLDPAAAAVDAAVPWMEGTSSGACGLGMVLSGRDAFFAAIGKEAAMFQVARMDDTTLCKPEKRLSQASTASGDLFASGSSVGSRSPSRSRSPCPGRAACGRQRIPVEWA